MEVFLAGAEWDVQVQSFVSVTTRHQCYTEDKALSLYHIDEEDSV